MGLIDCQNAVSIEISQSIRRVTITEYQPKRWKCQRFIFRQLTLIRNAFNDDTVIMGDFNIDYNKWFDMNYQRKDYFEVFEEKLGELNLLQLLHFDTWSRLVGSVTRSSLLDHLYVNNVTLVKNVKHENMCFGDHVLILVDLCINKPVQKNFLF